MRILAAPLTDKNRVRIERLSISQPSTFTAIAAVAMASAVVAGCSNPAKRVSEVAPTTVATAPPAADKSTTTIQCPPRGPFGNGPTYYSQFYEDYVLAYVFKDHEHGFYVDVGANDPDDKSVTKYFYLAGWRGINIEPIPELIEKLNKSRPEDTNKGVAISDRPGELPFYKGGGKASGLSTLSPAIAAAHRARRGSPDEASHSPDRPTAGPAGLVPDATAGGRRPAHWPPGGSATHWRRPPASRRRAGQP